MLKKGAGLNNNKKLLLAVKAIEYRPPIF